MLVAVYMSVAGTLLIAVYGIIQNLNDCHKNRKINIDVHLTQFEMMGAYI